MKRRRIDAVRNIARRIHDERAKKIISVTMENYPDSVYDFDKLARTHSCKVENQADLLERVIAISGSYLLGADRKYLRDVAFSAATIDWPFGKKRLKCVTLTKVKPEKELVENGWMVYWNEDGTDNTGTLLHPADDGYVPQVGDEAYFYTVQYTALLGRVINGHVFSYRTIEQYERDRMAY